MLVSEILFNAASLRPEQAAVWHAGTWKSYKELGEASRSFASFLVDRGVESGDRVALFLENSFDYIVAHFGILAAGAVEVSLNTDMSESDLEYQLANCEAKGLIAGRKFARIWKPVLERLPDLGFLILDINKVDFPESLCGSKPVYSLGEAINRRHQFHRISRNETDLASIVYTSGSTGTPKGVMLSHKNIVSNMQSIVNYLKLVPSDRMLVVLPFHYIYGRSLLYTHFLSGGSIAIDNRFAFPSAILNTMKDLSITCFAGVPSTFSILMRKTDFARREFPSLRLMTQAGGPMPPSLQKEVVEAIEPAELCIMYGSTEASPRLTYLEPDLIRSKWGSIGRPIPGVEIVLRDDRGKILPQGETGELVARGPNIMMGYWKDEEGTAQVLQNGYYRTGDLGYSDQDGCYFLNGRARDIIKVGGNRVSAKEIEECIAEIEGVVEAAVVGIPDEILGEAIKAFVTVNREETDENFISARIRRRMPTFKQPALIEILRELPKNQSGKILKNELRQRAKSIDRDSKIANRS